MTTPAPDEAALRRWWQGLLPPAEQQRIDNWFAALSAARQDELIDRLADAEPAPVTLAGEQPTGDWFHSLGGAARWRPIGELGRGGMGVVEAAEDRALGRTVAVKRCRPRDPGETPDAYLARRARFDREVAILAQLDHPGITPIHDVGSGADGQPAYCMQRLDGQPLDRYRASQPDQPPGHWVDLVRRCAEALAHAHSQGIVHRDVKPANVIVGDYGMVTLVDWGLAAAYDDATEARPCGTPDWQAPEQTSAVAPHPSMDCWGLGGLLLFGLQGCPPSAWSTERATALPRGLAAIIGRCLAVEPAERPASAAELVGDLGHWLAYGVAASQPLGPVAALRLWFGKHPRAGMALLVGCLACLLVAALVVWQGRHAADERRALATRLMAQVPLADAEAVAFALEQVDDRLRQHPDDAALRAAHERFAAAASLLQRRAELARQEERISGLAERYRRAGPWWGELADRLALFPAIGLPAVGDPALPRAIEAHPLRDALLQNLHQAFVAARLDERYGRHPSVSSAALATLIGAVVAPGGPDAALHALLATARLGPHEPELIDYQLTRHLPTVRRSPAHLDLLLALVAPDAKLVVAARERLATAANAYWPNIFLARMALFDGDQTRVRRHALIAHGHVPEALWPGLLLAYADLLAGADADGLAWVRRARHANPDNLEAAVLEAAFRARLGDHATARALLSDPHLAAHVRYHLEHPHGHPMERSCAVLHEAGVPIPTVPARIGPLVAPPETDRLP